MGGMIGTRLRNLIHCLYRTLFISAQKITPNTSMLARLFSTDSKRDHFKDEITAKNLPQYILKRRSTHEKKTD